MTMNSCRICAHGDTIEEGSLLAFLDYEVTIRSCPHCGCRFAPADPSIFEKLYKSSQNYYGHHTDFARQIKNVFDSGDTDALRAVICRKPKNAFLIDSVEKNIQPGGKILEIGCSTGSLSSYFIKAGYDISAMDISTEAISQARGLFGNHFYEMSQDDWKRPAYYDAVIHAGLIGCVEDPVAVTRAALGYLKPGGYLFFNAPNVDTLKFFDILWHPGSRPPDLITSFPPVFWQNFFSDDTDISIKIRPMSRSKAGQYMWRKLTGALGRPRYYLFKEQKGNEVALPATAQRLNRLMERLCSIPLSCSNIPDEMGVYVSMHKKT